MDEQVRAVHDQFTQALDERFKSTPGPVPAPSFAAGTAPAGAGKLNPAVVLHYLSVVLPTVLELIQKLQQPQQPAA